MSLGIDKQLLPTSLVEVIPTMSYNHAVTYHQTRLTAAEEAYRSRFGNPRSDQYDPGHGAIDFKDFAVQVAELIKKGEFGWEIDECPPTVDGFEVMVDTGAYVFVIIPEESYEDDEGFTNLGSIRIELNWPKIRKAQDVFKSLYDEMTTAMGMVVEIDEEDGHDHKHVEVTPHELYESKTFKGFSIVGEEVQMIIGDQDGFSC